jgi:hypothetical protein
MSEQESHNDIIRQMQDNLDVISAAASQLKVEKAVLARLAVGQSVYSASQSRWSGMLDVCAVAATDALDADPPNPGLLFREIDDYLEAHPNHHHDVVMSGK